MAFPLALVLPLLAFAAATALTFALGAGGLGTAATVGQIAFAVALVAVLVYGSPRRT